VPETINTSPLGRVRLDGYQRANVIAGPLDQLDVAGSKRLVSWAPANRCVPHIVPPVTKARPSGSTEWPEQKTSLWRKVRTWALTPVVLFQVQVSEPCSSSAG